MGTLGHLVLYLQGHLDQLEAFGYHSAAGADDAGYLAQLVCPSVLLSDARLAC